MSRFPKTVLLLIPLVLLLHSAHASLANLNDAIVAKVRASDVSFNRAETNVPFPPASFLQVQYYPNPTLTLNGTSTDYKETVLTQFLLLPVYIDKDNILFLGESAFWDHVSLQQPATGDIDIYTIAPMAVWLHQFNPSNQAALFAAAQINDGRGPHTDTLSSTTYYAGAIGLYWTRNKNFALIYGAVLEYNSFQTSLFPYLGFLWYPTANTSLALTIPWPAFNYAPSKNWLFTLGASPAGTTITTDKNNTRLQTDLLSYNLTAAVSYRFYKNLWLSAAAGWSGFGNLSLRSSNGADLDTNTSRGPVFRLAISYRPAASR